MIRAALKKMDGHVSKTAKLVGISPSSLQRKIVLYHLRSHYKRPEWLPMTRCSERK